MQNGFEAQPYTGKTAFEQWVEYEGVPMIRDFIVPDLNSGRAQIVGPRRSIGELVDAWRAARSAKHGRLRVRDRCPGNRPKPQRHLYRGARSYVLRGSGATTVWSEGAKSM